MLTGAAAMIAGLASTTSIGQCPPGDCGPGPLGNGCMAPSPCPAGCNQNGLGTDLGPTGAVKTTTEYLPATDARVQIDYQISNYVLFISGVLQNCSVTGARVRFWTPDNPPNNAIPCSASDVPSFTDCIQLLPAVALPDPGSTPPSLYTYTGGPAGSTCTQPTAVCAPLRYIVTGLDDVPNPGFVPGNPDSFPFIVKASACACGTSQTSPSGNNAINNRDIDTAVIHPEIEIVKSADVLSVCEGVSTQVTYTYLVTNPGDVNLINIVVTDNMCTPVAAETSGGFNVGDTNQNNQLERGGCAGCVGETWRFNCTTNISTSTTNIATVNGADFRLQVPVTDTDDLNIPANPPIVCTMTPLTSCDPNQTLTASGSTCITGCVCTCSWTKDGQPFLPAGSSCTVNATGPGVYCAVITDCHLCTSPNPGTCCATISSGPLCEDANISGPTPPITTCDSIEHCLTAVVTNTSTNPQTTYLWDEFPEGPCTIQGAANQLTVCFLMPSGPCTFRITATTPGCAQAAVCTKTVECQPPGGQGRTPGFWKQEQHWGYWGPYCPGKGCPCGTATSFCSAAGIPCDMNDPLYANCPGAKSAYFNTENGQPRSMLYVLGQGGGGFKALGRHAVAALLNAAVDPAILDYLYTTIQIQDKIEAAIVSCDPSTAHSELATENEREGGSLGGQCFCANPCDVAPGNGAQLVTADMTSDGKVNMSDLHYLLSKWGTNDFRADLDRNGRVNSSDMTILMSWWSQ